MYESMYFDGWNCPFQGFSKQNSRHKIKHLLLELRFVEKLIQNACDFAEAVKKTFREANNTTQLLRMSEQHRDKGRRLS